MLNIQPIHVSIKNLPITVLCFAMSAFAFFFFFLPFPIKHTDYIASPFDDVYHFSFVAVPLTSHISDIMNPLRLLFISLYNPDASDGNPNKLCQKLRSTE